MAALVNKITFTGSQGDVLAARLDLPPGEPVAIALFAHCFTCGKDIAAASRISAGLVAEGFGVLRFDFTGLGSSQGEFSNTNFTSNVDDLIAAADMLRDRHRAPSLLVGHSLGGAAVLAAAGRIPEVTAVATIAAPSDPAHVAGLFTAGALQEIDENGEAQVSLAGRSFRITRRFLDDIGRHRLEVDIQALGAALLVMHSPVDNLVDVDHARQIFEHARHPKSFVSLDTADHLLSDRADAAYVSRILSAWSSRYVPPAPTASSASGPTRTEGEVVVEDTGTGDVAQTIYAGRHVLVADEPLGVGDDTGPTPYDLVLAGLGACTSMTLGMYARRKGIPLDHVKVTLSHERTHAVDCAEPDAAPRRIEKISRHIELTGNLDEQQQARLLDIADKCPVHRTLEGDLRISTTIGRATDE